MQITVSMRRVKVLLVTVLAVLSVLGLIAEYAHYVLRSKSELIYYFSLSEEKNFPTWWSSFLLLACAIVLGAIAANKTRAAGQFRKHWAVLAAIFCYMSIDEFVEIHEWLSSMRGLDELGGVAYYGWVVPGGILVAAFAVSYLRFLFHLPAKTRFKVALAGALFVGGAFCIELILGVFTTKHGDQNFNWTLISWVEENMEMMGSSLFFYTLLEYLGGLAPDLRVAIRSGRD